MTDKETIKQMLEALEYAQTGNRRPEVLGAAITAGRQAIKQAEKQKPMAFNAGVPPLYPEMKDGETISVEYITQLAAPVQEPVAWFDSADNVFYTKEDAHKTGFAPIRALYTTPQQRKPLTDEQIEATFKRCGGKWSGDQWVIEDADLHPFVRAIESLEHHSLRAISDEYNAWIKHHAAGHSYDDFLAKRLAAHGIKE